MDRKKLIIDTDCGSDDAVAIAMVLNDPNFEVIMCTTVSGNVNCKQAAINTLTTIEHAGTYEPPVYMGAIDMLLRDMQYAAETHGEDGMGDVGLVPHRLKIGEGNGVIRMLEALKASEPGEIDIIALDDFLLTGGAAQAFGRHIQHLLELRQLIKQVAEAFWRLRFFQKGQQFTHLAQRTDILLPHPQRHATRRAEQVAQHRHGVAFRILKQQRRAAGAQSPVGNFGDFQVRIDRQSDTF